MRRINNFRINKESIDAMIKAGRFNPCLEITFRDKSGQHTHKLSAGYSDALDVYREGKETYVLSTSSRLGYVGLEVFEGADKAGDIFIEEYKVKEALGKDNLAPFSTIKRLLEHVM